MGDIENRSIVLHPGKALPSTSFRRRHAMPCHAQLVRFGCELSSHLILPDDDLVPILRIKPRECTWERGTGRSARARHSRPARIELETAGSRRRPLPRCRLDDQVGTPSMGGTLARDLTKPSHLKKKERENVRGLLNKQRYKFMSTSDLYNSTRT